MTAQRCGSHVSLPYQEKTLSAARLPAEVSWRCFLAFAAHINAANSKIDSWKFAIWWYLSSTAFFFQCTNGPAYSLNPENTSSKIKQSSRHLGKIAISRLRSDSYHMWLRNKFFPPPTILRSKSYLNNNKTNSTFFLMCSSGCAVRGSPLHCCHHYEKRKTYCCRINVTVNKSHFFRACLHHNKKMVRFRAMCVQTLVVTLLFYKATLPTTGVACTLPHFQSFRPDT